MEQESEGLTLGDLLQIIRKHIIAAIIGCAVVFGVTAAYTFTAPKKYEATAEVLASSSQEASDSLQASQYSSISTYISAQIATYPQLVKTEVVLQPVINQLGLNMTVDELGALVTASNPSKTFMVDITVETKSPQSSAAIANAVAESLSEQVSGALYSGSKKSSPVQLSVVQTAQTPQSASSPKTALYLAVGLVAGIVVGVLVALLKDILNTKISSTDDVRSLTGATSLGSIPDDEALNENKPIILAEPNGAIAEDYRRIRTNLDFLRVGDNAKHGQLIVMTSVSPSEGKTTTSVNVAAALAEDGKSVLLIDADLRHPSVAHKLGIEGHVGLTHILSGQAVPANVVQKYWHSNLHILPAGKRPANASILLNSDLMKQLVDQARTQYNYVLIDTAPLSVASDATVFGKSAGGVVLVTGKGVTEKKDLQDSVQALKSVDVPLLGFIFTFADPKKIHSDNYYYYQDGAEKPRNGRSRGKKKGRH